MPLDYPLADFLQCQVSLLEGKNSSALQYCVSSFSNSPNPVTLESLEFLAYQTRNEKILEQLKDFLQKREDFPHRDRYWAEVEALLSLLKGDYRSFAQWSLKAYSLGSRSTALVFAAGDHLLSLWEKPQAMMWTLYLLSQRVPQKEKRYKNLLRIVVFGFPRDGESFLKKLLKEEPQPFAYLWLAEFYDRRGDILEALHLLEEGLKRFPDNDRIAEKLALHYIEMGEVEKALLLAKKHSLKGVLLILNFAAESVRVAHSCGDKERLKELALKLRRTNPRGLKVAFTFLLMKHLDRALLVAGSQWLAVAGDSFLEESPLLTVYLLKVLELERRLPPEEEELVEKLKKDFSKNPLPKLVEAFEAALEGNREKVARLLEEVEPYLTGSYFEPYLGALRLYLGREMEEFIPALEHLYYISRQKAISLARRHWERNPDKKLLVELLNVFFLTGDLKAQTTLLEEAVKLYPSDADILNDYGYTLLQECGGPCAAKAKAYIEKAVEIKPDIPEYLDSLGWAYFHLKDYQRAKRYLWEALRLRGEEPVINLHYGWLLLKLGDREGAKKYILHSYRWFFTHFSLPENGFCENLKKLLEEVGERELPAQELEELIR